MIPGGAGMMESWRPTWQDWGGGGMHATHRPHQHAHPHGSLDTQLLYLNPAGSQPSRSAPSTQTRLRLTPASALPQPRLD
jgi:hypothetical protein